MRRAILDENNVANEEYLGVVFLDGPKEVQFGHSARCTLALIYFPEVSYSQLEVGATFTVREGAGVVGHGVVLERFDPLPGEPGSAV